MNTANMLSRTLLVALLSTAIFLSGCDSMQIHEDREVAIEQAVAKNAEDPVTLDDAVAKLHEVDFVSLAERVRSVPIEHPTSFSGLVEQQETYLDLLTEEEQKIFEQFYKDVAIDNAVIFNAIYEGSFEKLLVKYPDVLDCERTANKAALAPCDLECAGFIVAMAAMFASVTGGPLAYALGVAGFLIASESLGQCLDENNMETCW